MTSKKTPARKIAKRATTVKTAVVKSVAAPAIVDASVAPANPPSPSLEKQKLVRDSFTMPRREYEQIGALKTRLLKLEHAIKKGELLRAGIAALSALPDADLLAAVARIQRLKTGRPEKSRAEAKPSTKKKR